jgi:hypothetical protein
MAVEVSAAEGNPSVVVPHTRDGRGLTVGSSVECESLGHAVGRLLEEGGEDIVRNRLERDVVEGEEDRASDDVRLGGLERDGEDCEIVSVPSRYSVPPSDLGGGYVGRDVGDVDLRASVSANTRGRGWKGTHRESKGELERSDGIRRREHGCVRRRLAEHERHLANGDAVDDLEVDRSGEGDGDGELFDTCVEPSAVGGSSGVAVDDELRGDTVDEPVEDGRDVGESLRGRLGDESSRESEVDRRLGRQGDASSSDGTDHRRREGVEEADRRELDTDGRGVHQGRLEGEGDSTRGVVGGEIERLDVYEILESIHTVEDDLGITPSV